MADYNISVGVQINDSKLNTLKSDIANLTKSQNSIKLTIDPSSITSQFNSIKKQISQAGSSAGNDFVNGFNSSISKINLNNGKSQIASMQKTLASMKFDKSSIDVVTQDLEKMNLEISKITTSMRGSNLNVSVKGIDELGRAVTIVKQFNQETNKPLTVGKTISQSFDISADVAKKRAKEVEQAYKKLTNISTKYNNGQKDLSRLDKQGVEAQKLIAKLKELDSEYKSVYATVKGELSSEQIKGLTNIRKYGKMDADIVSGGKTDKDNLAQAKRQAQELKKVTNDAFNELINTQDKINSKQVKLKGLDKASEEAKELKASIDELRASYDETFAQHATKFTGKQKDRLIKRHEEGQMSLREKSGQVADKDNLADAKAKAKEIEAVNKELLSMSAQMKDAEKSLTTLKGSGEHTQEIKVLEEELNRLSKAYQELYTASKGDLSEGQMAKLSEEAYKTSNEIDRLKAKIEDANKAKADGLIGKFDKNYDGDLEKLTVNFDKIKNKSTEVTEAMRRFNEASDNMKLAKQSNDVDRITEAYDEYVSALDNANRKIRENQRAEKSALDIAKLNQQKNAFNSKLDLWLKENSRATKMFGAQIEELRVKLQNVGDGDELRGLDRELSEITRQAKLAGVAGQSFGDKFKSSFSKLSTYFSGYTLVMKSVQTMKEMYNNVHEVDTAMTELYRVTDLSSSQYSALYDNMVTSAKEYGSTLDNVISSTASWVRLGFNPNDANGLAEITSMYQHVTDLDESTAVNNLVTAYKGFEQQLLELNNGSTTAAVEMVSDIYDKLGNEFAVSAADVGSGLSRTASTLEMAGNTIQESAGMLVGITEITQDSDKAGNALKILSLRLRGMKGELQDLGEEVDDNVENISKMQGQILNLTHGKINIFNDDGTFKSTYEIMQGISEIWDKLTNTEQASLLETIAGRGFYQYVQKCA